ncbi:unnamed protein product [Macrosiphum euphorbiae]|uniref:Uncharacterized protein n=1 Tax=Macrosiphum euphorbiae TaxID=13131 RepID=A0AAV0W139_9HEMI|nr:unnamed protein product [Macrosiphum euphorbiae]
MKHFQEDTMLMHQQRLCEKNRTEKFTWLKLKMVEMVMEIHNERDKHFMIYDRLVEAIDLVLGTKCRHRQQYCCDCGEEADLMSFAKPTTKNLRSFRNLNTLTVTVG